MGNNGFHLNLIECKWWPDGDDSSIGWTLDLLVIILPSGAKYCLITVIWRGGWQPKLLAFGVVAGLLSFDTHGNFTIGPVHYMRDSDPKINGWHWNGFEYLR